MLRHGSTIFVPKHVPKQEEEIKSGANMVYVISEVATSGAFEGKKGATFMDILASAGGPTVSSTQLTYKDPATLQKAVSKWLEKYDRVIIDTSPLLNVNKGIIRAQSVASACDCALIVVA